MSSEVKYSLPFCSNALQYTKALIHKKLDTVSSYEELEKFLENSISGLMEDRETLESNYEAYRRKALNSWLDNLKQGACVQSIGTSERWQISLYFSNYWLEGFREDEIALIKQAALDVLNQDEKASSVGTFTRVIEIEKDICSSTAFICSCQ